ncbi:YitT family protein [Candidatus Phytoplasma melaleucae]|uniref:YitT family protein n=1 Tax=Candidatus Phytoplasma melaleucae TaxID=2982630 RepID=A0ABT9DDF2_9MOLU|nr:YitT family protein ['Melaleuca sp.' phytoplasma]MDO8167884.1 YitT family protein ['Melaleuca sp.' phytoplasma]
MKQDKFLNFNKSRWFLLILNDIGLALSIYLFTFGSKLNTGGIDGLSMITSKILVFITKKDIFTSNLVITFFMFFYNIVALIIGYRCCGKDFVGKTVFLVIILNLVIFLLSWIFNATKVTFLDMFSFDNKYFKLMVASVIGGFFIGLTLSEIRKLGYTTGGMDIFQQILKDGYGMNFITISFITDGLLILISAVLESIEHYNWISVFMEMFLRLLLSLVSVFIIGLIMEKRVKLKILKKTTK